MSNLLKFSNIYCEPSQKVVIDHNAFISEKIARLQSDIKKEEIIKENAEFIEGLQAEQVEMLISEDEVQNPEELKEQANLIIEKANAEAEAIIEKAKNEAEIMMHEASESGREQGYQDGIAQAEEEYQKQMLELEHQKEAMEEEYQQKVLQIEPMLVDTIVTVVERVTHVLGEGKEGLVLQLVNDVLTKSEVSKEFLIKVASEDYEYMMQNRDKIYGIVSKKVQIEIMEEPSYKKNQCVIESDSGIYDCSLDIQLQNLTEMIRVLSCMVE